MGTATMEGEDRALRAVEAALQSPLLEDNDIRGAQHILLNITSGTNEVTMDEVFEITEYVQEEAGYGTDLIWGNCYDETLGDQLSVTVIATGFETGKPVPTNTAKKERPVEKTIKVSLDDDEPKTTAKPTSSFLSDLGDDDNDLNFSLSKKKSNSNEKKTYSIENNKEETEKQEEPVPDNQANTVETLEERRQRLKNLSIKLNNPEVLNELENKPAYLRKGIKLDDVQHSSESQVSKWTISDDDEPEIKDNNSFLHDNVD